MAQSLSYPQDLIHKNRRSETRSLFDHVGENDNSIRENVSSILSGLGLESFGFAKLEKPFSIDLYREWIDQGFQGQMSYLERHLEMKTEPQMLLARAKSAIVMTFSYLPHPEPLAAWPVESLEVARYAKGRDYHHFLKSKLAQVIDELKTHYPSHEFVSFTDSSPVLERDLAVRAGLGWIGKNTCLISRENGSLNFIAEIYTTLSIEVAEFQVPKDFCGTCTRCMDACPTGALIEPRRLDARKCISYLTIESREVPEVSLRSHMGQLFYGCDICQTVCPWNKKVFGSKIDVATGAHSSDESLADLEWVLTSSNRTLEKAFLGTPLMRAGGWGLKRNALIVAGNMKSSAQQLRPSIEKLTTHEKLGELASWALIQIAE